MAEEWTVVTCTDKKRVMRPDRRRRERNKQVGKDATTLALSLDSIASQELVIQTLSQCRETFPLTDTYKNLVTSLERSNYFFSSMEQIVCYGIGNLATKASASMWQLACLLCLQTMLEERFKRQIPILFYDPVTTPIEAHILQKEFNISVLQENECGKRRVDGKGTLFFMPHCPLDLYRNAMVANWEDISSIMLFGNSLCAYHIKTKNGEIADPIKLARPFIVEEKVVVSKRDRKESVGFFEEAFNDSYLTWFRRDSAVSSDACWPAKPTWRSDGLSNEVIQPTISSSIEQNLV